ncbi:PRC-barrel domain-containing protein [Stappia sp.]|uniref:PRC-barrel domain-containing protein n=1 Tax=Stappia sp. TaxID=1870903 RepID=UPI003A98FC2F
MIRTLLTTTALAAALTTGALASDTLKTDGRAEAGSGGAVFSTQSDIQPMQSENGYFAASTSQILATSLIGKSLYNGASGEAEAIGEVNDVVLSQTGDAEAVVVGVGGFLGIGEKDVAIDFERVSWVERDGERWLTISATQEELETAPAFDRTVLMPENTAAMSRDRSVMADNRMTSSATETEQPSVSGEATGAAPTAPAVPLDKSAASQDPAMPSNDTAMQSDASDRDILAEASVASADELIGTPVYGAGDEDLGAVNDVIVSRDGMVEAFILDVGGFLGIGAKPVAIDVTTLTIKKDENGSLHIYTDYTQEQLEALPEYSGNAAEAKPDANIAQ